MPKKEKLPGRKDPAAIIADLEKRFSARHVFGDQDVIAVQDDLRQLKAALGINDTTEETEESED